MHLPHRHHPTSVSVRTEPGSGEPTMAAPMPFPLYQLADWFGPDGLFLAGRTIRVEDYQQDGNYVLRAELPGMDPTKDITVTVEQGLLRVDAERRQETHDGRRSEFNYGAFHRCLTLPQGVDTGQVSATYDDGILTVTVRLPQAAEPAGRAIPIQTK